MIIQNHQELRKISFNSSDKLHSIKLKNLSEDEKLAYKLDYKGYDGLCIIGGDGTMHEIINGMFKRPDKKKLPIG